MIRLKKLLLNYKTKLVYQKNKDKNYVFAYLYNIDKEKVREMLLSLESSEIYDKVQDKDLGFENRILYIWHPIRLFVAANGEERELELYIKTDVYDDKKIVVVISFHEIDDYS